MLKTESSDSGKSELTNLRVEKQGMWEVPNYRILESHQRRTLKTGFSDSGNWEFPTLVEQKPRMWKIPNYIMLRIYKNTLET